MRGGGQSPAGLFWALDALIRVTFVGGTTLWNYDTLSNDVTVLSKNSIVEYDNVYFWIGTDRFYFYNGVVQELPNDQNLNYFFDNLNFAQRQKVFAVKVQRFGEIWWFFPTGTNTECDAAIIFNVREKLWYDTRALRTAGAPAKVYPRPLMSETTERATIALKYTPTAGAFAHNQSIVGLTSGATGVITKATNTQLNLTNVTGTFLNAENIQDTTHGGVNTGTVSANPFTQDIATIWEHERGTDQVNNEQVSAIDSYIESCNLSFLVGTPTIESNVGVNYQLRIERMEPDFICQGNMTVQVRGRSYAQSDDVESAEKTFDGSTTFVDIREQRRLMTLKFRSNEQGGTFQLGRVLLTLEPGDERG